MILPSILSILSSKHTSLVSTSKNNCPFGKFFHTVDKNTSGDITKKMSKVFPFHSEVEKIPDAISDKLYLPTILVTVNFFHTKCLFPKIRIHNRPFHHIIVIILIEQEIFIIIRIYIIQTIIDLLN